MTLPTFTSFLLSRNLKLRSHELAKVRGLSSVATKDTDPKDVVDQQLFIESQFDKDNREIEIEKNRNKSRLYPPHRNMVHGKTPWGPDNPNPLEYDKNVRYRRRMYGRYGNSSNVDPRIAWPTDADLKYANDKESLSYQSTIQQMVADERKKIQEEEKAIEEHQKSIVDNLTKMQAWKDQLRAKLLKNMKASEEAKRKKDRLMEEVRRHVGFNVSVHDARFQEMLEAKEKEEKKAAKIAKKKAYQEAMVQKMLQMAEEDRKERKSGKKDEQAAKE